MHWDDDVNLYALVGHRLATGRRDSDLDALVPEEVLLFESEDSTSYELGFKSDA